MTARSVDSIASRFKASLTTFGKQLLTLF